MNSREELVNRIVAKEWHMFQSVNNEGGRASCQDDPATFKIMRSGQTASWSDAALESYFNDLEEAERSGRNLLTEKYARMMESTSPLEYAQIAHMLPLVDAEATQLIDRIMETVLQWEEELYRKYPYVLKRGRPIRRSQDSVYGTSLETYLRAELTTYSRRTIQLCLENVLKQKTANVNGSEIVLDCQVKQYGYPSLEGANNRLKQASENQDGSVQNGV